MDYLKQADKLLRVGSSDDIREFLPDLILEKNRLKGEAKAAKYQYDYYIRHKYIELKKEKLNGHKYSEKDIDNIVKAMAQDKFGDVDSLLSKVWDYEDYVNQLSQRKIDLAVDNKNYREAWL